MHRPFCKFLLSFILCWGFSFDVAHAQGNKPIKADPNRVVQWVSDLDGTLAVNVGNYRIFRGNKQTDAFLPDFPNLPEVIEVPNQDMDSLMGPPTFDKKGRRVIAGRLYDRLGKLSAGGVFQHSGDLGKVTLSNGQEIYPGYYYLDANRSFTDFQDPASAVKQRLKQKDAFVMEGAGLIATALLPQFAENTKVAILTDRDADAANLQESLFQLVTKGVGVKADRALFDRQMPVAAMAGLGTRAFAQYGHDKNTFLRLLSRSVSQVHLKDASYPHVVIMQENNFDYLKDNHNLFTGLSGRGDFSNPVIYILINAIEEQILERWNEGDWRRPMATEDVSRVQIYWPAGMGGNRIEHSDKLSRVLEVAYNLSPTDAEKLYLKMTKSKKICREFFSN